MGEIVVRDLDEEVIERLKRKADAKGVSLDEAAREALRAYAGPSREEVWAEIDRIRATSVPDPEFDSTTVIRGWRDRGRDGS